MQKYLIDSDVVLDVGLDRAPHFEVSSRVLAWVVAHPKATAVAWHSLSNIAYLLETDPRPFIEDLLRSVTIPTTGNVAAERAIALSITDFEDALQVAAAQEFGADYIATRNIRDYVNWPIPAITPADFLRKVATES